MVPKYSNKSSSPQTNIPEVILIHSSVHLFTEPWFTEHMIWAGHCARVCGEQDMYEV